ncbi:MAG: T9SS type A sorting domain-containing protein [Bacteroidales bacterium]|nr:T9SS type A sorting domain-containing protein [Bacteroidales bacterium]
MEWKYKKIFLLVLLCLLLTPKMNAQNCIAFRYDDSGNRMEMFVGDCGFEYKEQVKDAMVEMSINNMNEDLLVYPNPNKGTFIVELNNYEADTQLVVQIYNNAGIMIKEDRLIENLQIDITDNPAGAYLLRIIKDDSVYNRVVVKI